MPGTEAKTITPKARGATGERSAGGERDIRRERDVALCRSLLYEALALGFRPPTAHMTERLCTADSVEALADAALMVDAVQRTDLAGRTRLLAQTREAGDLEAIQSAHRRLFGHTVRGPVPAYETEYGEDTLFQKPQEMSDIAAFLRAFGLALDARRHERIDHVSCELEFMAFLARKEAHAIESGDEEMLAATKNGARLFLKDHLGRFAPSFARRVMNADPGGTYGRLAELCLDFVKSEGARLGSSVGPEMLRLRAPIDDRAPMACGGSDGCAPGPCGPDT